MWTTLSLSGESVTDGGRPNVARTSCSSYQWQYFTPLHYPRRHRNHTRIWHQMRTRTHTRTTVHLLRRRHCHYLAPRPISMQTALSLPFMYILTRILRTHSYPNKFQHP